MSMDMGAWHHHQAEASSCSACLSTAPSVVCKQVSYMQSLTFTFVSWWWVSDRAPEQGQAAAYLTAMDEKGQAEVLVLAFGESGI